MNQRNSLTIGLDVGDKHSQVCVLDTLTGELIEEARIRTTPTSIRNYFERQRSSLITLEVGTHSPWIDRELKQAGHEVLIANARKVSLIHGDSRKNDRLDAEKLARLARIDKSLLAPIQHRTVKMQADLARIRTRDALVRNRTALINHVRGSVKAFGARIPAGYAPAFTKKARQHLPAALAPALEPALVNIDQLTASIKQIEKELAALVREYPSTTVLQQVDGAGLLTSLTFQLVIADPNRFKKSREVGPYLGLTPGQHQSGERNPKKRITKEGDPLLRRLLIQCAHYIIRSKRDSDLKRAGLRIKSNGAPTNLAVTAVARKLAVLLHHLWITGEVYEPLYNHPNSQNEKPLTA